jgi:phosphate starvation-inducible PhoH-like protein
VTQARKSAPPSLIVSFPDNRFLSAAFGDHDRHLPLIERRLAVRIVPKGNQVVIEGPQGAAAREVLQSLYDRARDGEPVGPGDVDGAIRMAEGGGGEAGPDGAGDVRTKMKRIKVRSPNQGRYITELRRAELVFGEGPAGTGKTYMAVAVAVEMLLAGKVDRLVLSRPAVEAGERLGFLPGDLKEKVDPYLRPLYDALFDMLPGEEVRKRLETGQIEVAPLAFMRGRTLASAFVILDEAQNTTPEQMKMLLTRLGEHSRMVITGDLTQIDLPSHVKSGLRDALEKLRDVPGISVVRFTDGDVVRHPLVQKIVRAYAEAAGELPLRLPAQEPRKPPE